MRNPKIPVPPIAEWDSIDAKDFWRDTTLKETYGVSVTIQPDQRFLSLMVALKSYYSTYNPKLGGVGDGGHDSARVIYPTVVFMAMFIEKFLVSYFDRERPWVSRGDEKQKKHQELTDEELRLLPKTVRFESLITRLYGLIDQDDPAVDSLRCFAGHKEAILKLSIIRNELVHKGDTLPKVILIDVLFVNSLLPLVHDLLESLDMDYRAIDHHTYCGVRVLDALCRMKLSDEDVSSSQTKNRRMLDHLKALGKAAFDSPIFHGLTDIEQEAYGELKSQVAKMVLDTMPQYENHPNIITVHRCPCCGVECLMTSGYFGPNQDGFMIPNVATCRLCQYRIHFIIGNPSDYGLMDEPVFSPIPHERWMRMSGAQNHIRFWNRMSTQSEEEP